MPSHLWTIGFSHWMHSRLTWGLGNKCFCVNTRFFSLFWYNWPLIGPGHWCFVKFLSWFNRLPGLTTIDLCDLVPTSFSNLISSHSFHNLPFSTRRPFFPFPQIENYAHLKAFAFPTLLKILCPRYIHLTFQQIFIDYLLSLLWVKLHKKKIPFSLAAFSYH